MAKAAQQKEQEFIATVQEVTGKDLATWLKTLADTNLTKTNDLIKWLKSNHAFNHMQANILTGIYLNNGEPVHDYDKLFAKLFDGKTDQRPIYDALAQQITDTLADAELIPTKTYVSIEAARVFGCIKINSKDVRLGLDVANTDFADQLEPAKGLGAMPNISHMLVLEQVADIPNNLAVYLTAAYQRTHT